MRKFKEKIVLVTGGARGIGFAICEKFIQEEATVIFTDIDSSSGDKANQKLGSSSIFIQQDVCNENEWQDVMLNIKKNHGDLSILVNNAGIHMDNILLRMQTEEWKKVLDVNLNGPFYLTRILLKDMIKNKRGRIINISSISGTDGNKGQSNYSASKGGLLAFTKSLAKEVGKRNITVNCIAPGIIETDMIFDLSDTVKTDYLRRIPLKKFGKPEDISKMILFLCSDEASYITGQTFYIDGGMSLN